MAVIIRIESLNNLNLDLIDYIMSLQYLDFEQAVHLSYRSHYIIVTHLTAFEQAVVIYLVDNITLL